MLNFISFDTRRRKTFILLLRYISLVVCATVTGHVLFLISSQDALLLTRGLLFFTPSFTARLLSCFFPLCVTLLVVYWNRPWILHIVISLKIILLSYATAAIFTAFPSSGWVVQFLVMFTEWFAVCIYHWLWLRILVYESKVSRRFTMCTVSVLSLVVLFDFSVIQPITALLYI